MIFLIFLIFLNLFYSCNELSEKEKLAYKILLSFTEEQEKKNNLNLFGIGGSIPDKIHGMNLHLVSNENITLNRARKLYIECTQDLLNKVNSNLEIRPYLENYPFDEKNIDFTLIFKDESGKIVNPPYIAFIFMNDGKISYDTYVPNNESNGFCNFHKETYQEALKIVMGQ